jgi:hypothetical protein
MILKVKLKTCHLFEFISFVKIWNFAAAQNVVDIFEEGFLDDLSVSKEEDGRFIFNTSRVVEPLQICKRSRVDTFANSF